MDGPDEVHLEAIAKLELREQQQLPPPPQYCAAKL